MQVGIQRIRKYISPFLRLSIIQLNTIYSISELHTETIGYFAKKTQPTNGTKKPNPKTCPNPHKQIKMTANIRFQPTQTFFNFENMKVSTVSLVTQVYLRLNK